MARCVGEPPKTLSQQRAEELRQAWLRPRSCQAQSSYIRVRRLPPGVTSSELLAFFRGYGTVLLDIRFFPGSSEECLLQLPSVSHAQNLLVERGKLFLFGSSLELLPATEDESRALGFLLHARELLQGSANTADDRSKPVPHQTTQIGELEIPQTLDTPPPAARKASRSHSPLPRPSFTGAGAHCNREQQARASGSAKSMSPPHIQSTSGRELYHGAHCNREQQARASGSAKSLSPGAQCNREQQARTSGSAKSMSPPHIQSTSGREPAKYGANESPRSQYSRVRTTSPRPSTPRALASSVSPRGYSCRHKSPLLASQLGRPPPLPNDLLAHHKTASIATPRRAESAPPAVLGELPVPAKYWEYSAREWNIAVNPMKMENLRQHLASVHCETAALRSSFEKDVCCCSNLEEKIEAGRMRMRDLREEEAATMNAEYAGKFKQAEVELECDAEILALRYKTELLASEVETAAQLQLARCESLNDMRIAAKLARVRQDVKGVFTHCAKLQVDQQHQRGELEKAVEAAQSLKGRVEELRSGAHQEKDKEFAALAFTVERETAQREEIAALRLEITQAINAKQIASNTLAAQHQVHEARRNNVSDLTMRLAETRVATHRFAKKLQEIGDQGASMKLKLGEIQGKTKAINVQVGAGKVAGDMLVAELQQQRDATMAWQVCVDDLELGQLAISEETARVVNASREALCSMAAGVDEAHSWSHARLPMPTR